MTRVPKHIDLDVEPLSDRSWHRVEDGLFAQLDRAERAAPVPAVAPPRPSRWRPALAIGGFAAAAAATAVAVMALTSSNETATSPLRSSRVETGDAPSRVTHGEASLTVAAESALVLSGDDERGLLVVLEHGRVDCSVPPRRGRPPFAVQAGGVRVEVVGTRFAVSREQNTAAVEVIEGVVDVIADGQRARVRAGERWPAARTAAVTPDDLAPAPEPEPEPEVTMEPMSMRARHLRRARPEPREPAPPPPPTARQRFMEANALEPSEPDAAAAIYRELARESGPWAANALYALARLELDRGRRGAGRRLLRTYLERFPDGPNAADARELLDGTR